MPQYYFHLRDGEDRLLDEDGRDLTGRAAIEAAALEDARSIIAEEVRKGRVPLYERIEVEDERGTVVHVLEFADAVEVSRAKPG